MQRMPNLQQNPFAIFTPLAIPKADHLDIVGRQKTFPSLVTFELFGCAVLETIQFNRQARERAIEVKIEHFERVLAAEFEARKTARAEGAPQFLLLFGLLPPQTPGVWDGVHDGKNISLG